MSIHYTKYIYMLNIYSVYAQLQLCQRSYRYTTIGRVARYITNQYYYH